MCSDRAGKWQYSLFVPTNISDAKNTTPCMDCFYIQAILQSLHQDVTDIELPARRTLQVSYQRQDFGQESQFSFQDEKNAFNTLGLKPFSKKWALIRRIDDVSTKSASTVYCQPLQCPIPVWVIKVPPYRKEHIQQSIIGVLVLVAEWCKVLDSPLFQKHSSKHISQAIHALVSLPL